MSRHAKILWLAFALISGPAFAQSEIRWAPDLVTARRAATQFQVPMLIHFYGDNCLPCRTLEQRVLSQDSVVKTLNKYFICVRVNASQDRGTATEYQVHSWPTDVFVSADGQVLYQGVCKQDIPGYMDVLQHVAVSNRDRNTQIAADRAKQTPQAQQNQFAASTTAPQSSLQPVDARLIAAPFADSSAIAASTPAAQFQVPPPSRPGMMDSNAGLPPLAGHLASKPLGSDGLGSSSNVANRLQSQTLPSVANVANNNAQKQMANNPAASLVSNPYFPDSEPMVCTPDGKCGPASSMAACNPQTPTQPATGVAAQNTTLVNSTQNKWMQPTLNAAGSAGPQFPPLSGVAAAPSFQPKSGILVGSTRVIPNDETASQPNIESSPGLIEITPQPEMEPAAFSGFCPISLVKAGLKVQGKTEYAVRHRGRIYLMESLEAAREFLQSPDRYSPVLSGYDPMIFLETGKLVDGTLEHALYDPNSGMIILFANANSQTKFKADPARNTKALGYILDAATKK
jgi:thioredoxin-related protein